MQTLLETVNKKLVKCTKDYLWGTGVPLNDAQCLTEKCWKDQGLQGIMLQEIRQKHVQIARAVLPTINQWHLQGPPQLLQPGLVPCDPVINSSGKLYYVILCFLLCVFIFEYVSTPENGENCKN